MHTNGLSGFPSGCSSTEIASSALCTWELRALNPQGGQCLVDARLDLGTDLTPVQMPFSSLHCCSVLPMRTVMLGLGNATHVGAARHAIVNSGVQPAALFIHPKLPDHTLSQFIEDNKRANKVSCSKPLILGCWAENLRHRNDQVVLVTDALRVLACVRLECCNNALGSQQG